MGRWEGEIKTGQISDDRRHKTEFRELMNDEIGRRKVEANEESAALVEDPAGLCGEARSDGL